MFSPPGYPVRHRSGISIQMRTMRTMTLEVMRQDYIHCVGQGRQERRVMFKHAFRNP